MGARWLAEHAHEGVPFVLVPTLRQKTYGNVPELIEHGAQWSIPQNFPPRDWPGGPVLAPWATNKTLKAIERANAHPTVRIESLCVLKWEETDCREWLAAREAIDVTAPDRDRTTPTIDDGVVLVAMESLTGGVNLGTGLSHPLDRMAAIRTLEYLTHWDHALDASEIVSWALANGWSSAGGDALNDIIDRLNDGRTFRNIRRFRIRDRGELRRRWELQARQRGL